MKDYLGHIIYVGKSKNLKNRVQSYFQNSTNHSKKVEKLVTQIKDFDYILTDTEFEAFMLECQLIQKIKPFYNKLMKSPQSYTYITFRMNKGIYRIECTYEKDLKNGCFSFGPYTSKKVVGKAIQHLQECFKLQCSNQGNTNNPCLNYSLGLCIGICFQSTAAKEYQRIMTSFIALLKGTDEGLLKEMHNLMMEAAVLADFERAAKLRDGLEAIQSLIQKEKVLTFTKDKKNIVVLEKINDCKVKLFLINQNKILLKKGYVLEKNRLDFGEWMKLNIQTCFKQTASNIAFEMKKEEIDEAQIVYRYLNRETSAYLVIPENWLEKDDSQLDNAIQQYIRMTMEETIYLS